MENPKPGSPAAVSRGCTCHILDNGHGHGGYGDGIRRCWWIDENCPLHGKGTDNDKPE